MLLAVIALGVAAFFSVPIYGVAALVLVFLALCGVMLLVIWGSLREVQKAAERTVDETQNADSPAVGHRW